MSDSQAQTLPIGETARLFGVSTDTIREWDAKGYLPSFRTPGGQRRFRRDDIDALIESGRSA